MQIKQHQIRLKVAGSNLQITSEDLDFSNRAEERLACQYEGVGHGNWF